MKKRALRFESLEERQLLAVTAGLASPPLPAPLAAAPAGYSIGDVYIARDYSAIWEAQAAVMDVVTNAAKQEKVPLKVANL